MSDSAGEKSFAPTAKKRGDAAKKGDVLRSRDAIGALVVLAGTFWLWLAGPMLLEALRDVFRLGLRFDAGAVDDFQPGRLLIEAAMAMLVPLALLFAATIAAALAGGFMLGQAGFRPELFGFKASRLDPLAGLKRLFGPQGWAELLKSLLKIGLLGLIGWRAMAMVADTLPMLSRGTPSESFAMAGGMLLMLVAALTGGLLVIALIDAPLMWWQQQQRLRMTMQDMRDEHKESEGSPEKKAAIRQRQREIFKGSVRKAMDGADVVLTNPSHFAVILRYAPDKAPAPLLLAKGRGAKALAIRDVAREMGVTVLEYPRLARGLYFTAREGQMIRSDLYAAVAAVLAFVYGLRQGADVAAPTIAVPLSARFDEHGRAEN